MPKASLNVQCFVEKKVKSIFEGENQPKLLYVSEIRPDASAHPRVMHAHEDFVELILICSGSSEYLIHDKKVIIKPGDLLVYNAGVVHDEVSGPDMEVGSYCIAVGGLHMPGLRENALIPDDAGYVFPTGKYFADLRCLFEMMFRTLSAGEPNAELFCSSLMHALLVSVLTVTAVLARSRKSRWRSRTFSADGLRNILTSIIWSRSRCRAWVRHCTSVRITYRMFSSR